LKESKRWNTIRSPQKAAPLVKFGAAFLIKSKVLKIKAWCKNNGIIHNTYHIWLLDKKIKRFTPSEVIDL
jgi:hypothetical protein